jgi:hypothetical protein
VKRIARLVALPGALAVGWLLLGVRPRDVVLVYDLSTTPDATAVEVELRSDGALVRRARMPVRPGEQVRHAVKLRDGGYDLSWRVERPSGASTGARTIEVGGDETIVLALGR